MWFPGGHFCMSPIWSDLPLLVVWSWAPHAVLRRDAVRKSVMFWCPVTYRAANLLGCRAGASHWLQGCKWGWTVLSLRAALGVHRAQAPLCLNIVWTGVKKSQGKKAQGLKPAGPQTHPLQPLCSAGNPAGFIPGWNCPVLQYWKYRAQTDDNK